MQSLNINEKRFKDALFVFFAAVCLMIFGITEFIHILVPVGKHTLYVGAGVFGVGSMVFLASLDILKEAFPCQEEEKQADLQ